MEEEMSMLAEEHIETSQDITPPLPPLAFSLHDAFLPSHCSSCFSPLPPSTTTTPYRHRRRISYCSVLCAASDQPLHLSSSESHLLNSLPPSSPSSDLRTALRLLHILSSDFFGRLGRISGLLTNYDKLTFDRGNNEVSSRVRDGARAMRYARTVRGNEKRNDVVLEYDAEFAALCLVITNAVEVRDKDGRALGIAVYDTCFSWINHSCSPNSVYRFLISPPCTPLSRGGADETRLRIVPSGGGGKGALITDPE